MKMTKRIFITLLILAVTVSALAVSAYAAEPDGYDYGYCNCKYQKSDENSLGHFHIFSP